MKNLLFPILLLPLPCLAQDFKAYQNYDFVAGNNLIFADDLADSPLGEFDPHWKLIDGQAVVNKAGDEKAFFITKYYTKLAPRVKTPAYLPKNFTVEFDSYLDAAYDSNEGIYIQFMNGTEPIVTIKSNRDYSVFEGPDTKLNGEYPKAIAAENYLSKWHHYAIAVKDNQVKIYCDQYRVLVVPESIFKATSLVVGGDASDGMNMMFRNFRLAAGGDMNLIGKAFTEGKYISHGIHFDVAKATLKPESMGEMTVIVKVLTDNPTLKVEVSGHTDSDGDDAGNLKLSEARATTVKAQLVSMGIDAARLTAKGYGETKPIADNATFDGKAQNRRVEFIKQ